MGHSSDRAFRRAFFGNSVSPAAFKRYDEGIAMTYLISERTGGHSRVIRVDGELDLAVAPRLKEDLHRLIDEGERHIVLDLTEATFIDSTTIGALLSATRRVREYNGSLEIVCTNRNVLRTFEFAGLDRLFQFHSSLDELVQPAPAI